MEEQPTKQQLIAMGLSYREWYRAVYLYSDHWKSLREKAFSTHGRRCAKCSTKKRLDVHHLNYRDIYDVTVDDLQVLCRRCHELEHPIKHEIPVVVESVQTISKKALRKKRKRERQQRIRAELGDLDQLIEKWTKSFSKHPIPLASALRHILRKFGWRLQKGERQRLKRMRIQAENPQAETTYNAAEIRIIRCPF